MGRRARYIVLLLIVLMMIYAQQPVIYAENEENVEEVEKPEIPEEPQKPIEKFKIVIPNEDGKHGYYITKPEVSIQHISERGVTRYQLCREKEVVTDGIISRKDETVILKNDLFGEGRHQLFVWMEDEEGQRADGDLEFQKTFYIDTQPPIIEMQLPDGFDNWYQKQVTLKTREEDAESGVDSIACYVNGKCIGKTEGGNPSFLINEASNQGKPLEAVIVAEDKAGNKIERKKSLYIDNTPPQISLKGATNYLITSQPLTISYEIHEDNGLQEIAAITNWENVRGEMKELTVSEWKPAKNGKMAEQILTEDGIYRMHAEVLDLAGYADKKEMQVIIDKENPVIQYVDALNHQYLKSFAWAFPKEEFIQDFTTYTHEIRVDGRLYPMGKKITAEGKHRLEVTAQDAAGNESAAHAEFIIDHTEPEIVFIDVEDGAEYEEQRTFKVGIKGSEDVIEEIHINEERQKVDSGSKVYQYTVEECRDYEVRVKAKDKAGNESEKSILFKIKPKETLLQKIAKPFARNINKENHEAHTDKERKELSITVTARIAGIGMIVGIGLVAAGIYFYRKKKNEGDEMELKS